MHLFIHDSEESVTVSCIVEAKVGPGWEKQHCQNCDVKQFTDDNGETQIKVSAYWLYTKVKGEEMRIRVGLAHKEGFIPLFCINDAGNHECVKTSTDDDGLSINSFDITATSDVINKLKPFLPFFSLIADYETTSNKYDEVLSEIYWLEEKASDLSKQCKMATKALRGASKEYKRLFDVLHESTKE